jgi:hypothetical protein
MNLSNIHPRPVQIFRLWQTFLDNVNPLSKLLHAPTWQTRVLEASENLDAIPRATEVLLFAIYTAAVASLNNEECGALVGDSKSALLSRYSAATHQALIEAGFMKTSDLVVLQGFVLFLLARRQEHDPHELWILFKPTLLGDGVSQISYLKEYHVTNFTQVSTSTFPLALCQCSLLRLY